MASKRLEWDKVGERYYETGVEKCVLYVQDKGAYPKGVAWNGLTAVNENPSGADTNAVYADNIKYLNLLSSEDFGATIEALMYPDEFKECNGESEIAKGVVIGQQKRKQFGLCYRTLVGNDTDGEEHAYKLHIIYGALAAPSANSYQTINDSPDTVSFSWEISTTPVNVSGKKPTALLVIDSRTADAEKLKQLEDILYGSENTEPRLPLPDEIITLMSEAA
jgi:hypothetical protein